MNSGRFLQLEGAYNTVVEDRDDVHISGQPGIGKTGFLTELQRSFDDGIDVIHYSVKEHHTPDTFHRDLLYYAREQAPIVRSLWNRLEGMSGSLGPLGGAGGSVDGRERAVRKLEDLTDSWGNGGLVICIDDVHELDDDYGRISGVLDELVEALGPDVRLVTAGQMPAIEAMVEYHLEVFNKEETREFLTQHHAQLSDDTIDDVHTALDGHPMHLKMAAEAADSPEDFRLPEEGIEETIRDRYLETLDAEHELFLRSVAPLPEFTEASCAAVADDCSRGEASRYLRALRDKIILEPVNRTECGDVVFKVHELFREILARKHKNPVRVHRSAFEYHIEEYQSLLAESDDEDDEEFFYSLPHTMLARYHLHAIHSEITVDAIQEEVDRLGWEYPERGYYVFMFGLQFAPSSAPKLWGEELDVFEQWALGQDEADPEYVEFVVDLIDLVISQFDDDRETIPLSDISLEGDLETYGAAQLPELDFPEGRQRQLNQMAQEVFRFFLTEEPYDKKKHRELLTKALVTFGITEDVLITFIDECRAVIQESDVTGELDQHLDAYSSQVSAGLEEVSTSKASTYVMKELVWETGQEMFREFNVEVLLESGFLSDLWMAGGKALEDAENPGFALLWYELYLLYANHWPVSLKAAPEIRHRSSVLLEEYREFIHTVDEPMLDVDAIENKGYAIEGAD